MRKQPRIYRWFGAGLRRSRRACMHAICIHQISHIFMIALKEPARVSDVRAVQLRHFLQVPMLQDGAPDNEVCALE
eukprot:63533-Chlamydomonas_euryale.AAC.1